jgi:hypothetical protein
MPVDKNDPRYKAAFAKWDSKYSKMPTRDLLNEWDSEDLIHYLQANKMLDESKLNPALQRNASLKANQEYQNLRKGGSLQEIAQAHAKWAAPEGLELPVNPDGVINSEAALKNIFEAKQAIEQREHDRALTLGATEQMTTTVNPQGQKTITGQMMTKTGQPTSPVRTVTSEAPQTEPLRKEYSAQPPVHDFNKVHAGYNKLLRSVNTKEPNALKDQNTIFQWMKILDPGSTVREGEYATVEKARGVPDRIRNVWNQIYTGQILTPEQRKEILDASQDIVDGQIANVAPIIKQFQAQEKTGGHAPGSVVPIEHQEMVQEFEEREAARAKAAAPAAAPAAGAAPAAAGAAPAAPVQQKPIPTVRTPTEAPADAEFFYSPKGKLYRNPNYRPAAAAPAPATPPPTAEVTPPATEEPPVLPA